MEMMEMMSANKLDNSNELLFQKQFQLTIFYTEIKTASINNVIHVEKNVKILQFISNFIFTSIKFLTKFNMRPSRLCHAIVYIIILFMLLHIFIISFLLPNFSFSLDLFSEYSAIDISFDAQSKRLKSDSPLDNSEYLQQFRYPHQSQKHLLVNADNIQSPIILNKSPVSERPRHNLSQFNSIIQTGFTQEKWYDPFLLRGHINRSSLYHTLHEINFRQEILNNDIYADVDVIIAVQVHSRLEYLKLLVESLRRAKDIHRALLIFSHDMYNANINSLVRSIGFAKVTQIFFPYSQQLFDQSFPGKDPLDCPRNINKKDAESKKCLNWQSPDNYGHYREASFCQTKHHWFWKANFIFSQLRGYEQFQGPVLFLEEDHYVVEDFLHMLFLMRKRQLEVNKDVNILCLGTYEKKVQFVPYANWISLGKWISGFHNMGMAFDRTVWNSIQHCAEMFCQFDDYNWDWSLYYLNIHCLSSPLTVMLVSKSPRVFHIGDCGVHHKTRLCSPRSRVNDINNMLTGPALENLYPQTLQTMMRSFGRMRNVKPYGGWGDSRDHALCHAFANLSTSSRENISNLLNERRLLSDSPLILT